MHGPEGDDEEEDGSGLDDVAAQRIQGDGGLENLEEEEEEEDLMHDSRNDCDSVYERGMSDAGGASSSAAAGPEDDDEEEEEEEGGKEGDGERKEREGRDDAGEEGGAQEDGGNEDAGGGGVKRKDDKRDGKTDRAERKVEEEFNPYRDPGDVMKFWHDRLDMVQDDIIESDNDGGGDDSGDEVGGDDVDGSGRFEYTNGSDGTTQVLGPQFDKSQLQEFPKKEEEQSNDNGDEFKGEEDRVGGEEGEQDGESDGDASGEDVGEENDNDNDEKNKKNKKNKKSREREKIERNDDGDGDADKARSKEEKSGGGDRKEQAKTASSRDDDNVKKKRKGEDEEEGRKIASDDEGEEEDDDCMNLDEIEGVGGGSELGDASNSDSNSSSSAEDADKGTSFAVTNLANESEEDYFSDTYKGVGMIDKLRLDAGSRSGSPSIDSGSASISNMKTWRSISSRTLNVSRRLCEKLRLALEPTIATKMTGEHRTGKRINMKKIVGYVASGYRKDKIWMRRRKPAKRDYKIVLAVDDSESMVKGNANVSALECVSVLTSAIGTLEAGDVSVCKFGETVNFVHDFGSSFGDASGANVVKEFTFRQRRTRVLECVESCFDKILSSHAASSSSSARSNPCSSILFLISDGKVERDDRSVIRDRVRKMGEMGVLVVAVIVDATGGTGGEGKGGKDSGVLNCREVAFDGNGKPVITMFMDKFPFPFYAIVKNVEDIPEVVGDSVKQWIETVGV